MILNANQKLPIEQSVQWGVVLFGAFVFLIPAIWNGFPFIFTDSLSYIISGIDLIAPPDRPIFYGIFIRITNLVMNLWGSVICQAILLSVLLVKLAKKLFPSLNAIGLMLWLVFIAIFTAAPWFIGQISPDIFSAILFLALAIWVIAFKEANILDSILICLMLILSICVHSSNLLICICSSLIIILWLIAKKESWKNIRKFIAIIIFSNLISVFLILASNVWSHYGVTLNPSGKVFMLARLLEDGPGLEFLKNNCNPPKFKTCASLPMLERAKEIELTGNSDQDPELKNLVASSFLWGGGLQISGGIFAVSNEASQIINQSIRQYPFIQIQAVINNTWDQLGAFAVGEQLKSTLKLEAINKFFYLSFPESYEDYLNSRQSSGNLSTILGYLNPIFFYVVLISLVSLVIIFATLVISGTQHHRIAVVIGVLFIFEIINAAITGALSGVFDRYQSRVIWLLPAIAALFFLGSLKAKLPLSIQKR